MKGSAKIILPIAIAGAVLFVGAGVWMVRNLTRLADSPESGVVVGMPLPANAVAALMKNRLLEPGERPLAYYDDTMSLDGTDISVLTNRRVIRFKDGKATTYRWEDVTKVDRNKNPVGADVFMFHTRSGELLEVDVQPLNGGDLFATALDEARKAPR